ncbi:MAG: hypothetical protein WA672_01035 [Candidatus Angelobacter sp.]
MADSNGILNLNVVNVYQQDVAENVTVILKNQQLMENRFFPNLPGGNTIQLQGLMRTPQGRYLLEIDSPSYQPVSQFINIPASGDLTMDIVLPVNPNRVTSMERPDMKDLLPDLRDFLQKSSLVIGGKKGVDLFPVLPDILCAGLLNLVAKARQTLLSSGKPALSYLLDMVDLHGDRLFAKVSPELPSECKRSETAGILHSVSDALHDPLPGFERAASYKTFDHYGNLQLTLSNNPESGEWMVDMDIDDAQGLEHVFQVVHNTVAGEPTNPYNIHEILVEFQQLDPGYSLRVGETIKAKAATA